VQATQRLPESAAAARPVFVTLRLSIQRVSLRPQLSRNRRAINR